MNDQHAHDHPTTNKERRAEEKAEQAATDRAHARTRTLMQTAKYLGIGGVLVGIVVGLVALSQGSSTDTIVVLPSAITADDWTEGNPEAVVTIVEYSDLQCPTCAKFNPIVGRIMEEYGDEVYFAYRHFPLKTIHRNAESGARAAEAAGKQGAFFAMLNILFAKQSEWSVLPNPEEAYESYAESLGLNAAQFTADYASSEVEDLVDADYRSAIQAGLQGTPTFFVNGVEVDLPNGYDGFKQLIEEALARTSQTPDDVPVTVTE